MAQRTCLSSTPSMDVLLSSRWKSCSGDGAFECRASGVVPETPGQGHAAQRTRASRDDSQTLRSHRSHDDPERVFRREPPSHRAAAGHACPCMHHAGHGGLLSMMQRSIGVRSYCRSPPIKASGSRVRKSLSPSVGASSGTRSMGGVAELSKFSGTRPASRALQVHGHDSTRRPDEGRCRQLCASGTDAHAVSAIVDGAVCTSAQTLCC